MSDAAEMARIVRVFVSCPGDVEEEIEALKEVVARINRADGQYLGARLELWQWKDNAACQIGPGPQEVIDGQIPDYDIYLGIMWARYGTPTGEHGSGTVAEYHDAVKRKEKTGKPIVLLFFFNEESCPSNKPGDIEQWLKVRKFHDGLKGLKCPYQGASAFLGNVDEQLRQWFRRIVDPDGDGKGGGSITARFPEDYREWLREQCSDIDLLGMEVSEGYAPRLTNVYVPLTTPEGERKEPGDADDAAEDLARRGSPGEKSQTLLLELLGKESLYVTGDAGTGKSTFCRWVATILCHGDVPDHEVGPPKDYREQYPDALRGKLPLLIPLREFWEFLPRTPGRKTLSSGELEEALAKWLNSTRPPGLSWPIVEAHLRQGTALLVFDGVDEVPRRDGDRDNPCAPCEMLVAGLAQAIPQWRAEGNVILATSRPYGLEDAEVRKLSLRHVRIGELPEELQQLLVWRWFTILKSGRIKAKPVVDKMIGDLQGRQELWPMRVNPLLLTAMCIIYGEGKELPQDKHDLYHRIVHTVLRGRYPNDPTTIARVRRQLSVIAYGMHTGEDLDERFSHPQAEITNGNIDRLLLADQDQQGRDGLKEKAFLGAVATRNSLLGNSGLLIPKEQERAGFYHLSFQEFLAAERLLAIADWEGSDLLVREFVARSREPGWHNTLAFIFAALLFDPTKLKRGVLLLDRLIGMLDEESLAEQLGLAATVAVCLEMLLRKDYRLARADEFREICLAAIQQEVPLGQRQRLGLSLGQLEDPRVVVDLRHCDAKSESGQTAFVQIETGTYPIGDERKPWKLEEPFLLSRYPVTNSQFALFIEAGGYKTDRWWSEEGRRWVQEEGIQLPAFWHNPLLNGPNQPVVGVSFWEAEAFAAWAGRRLPTANEWEAAAAGPEGLEYPWGNEWEDGICNSFEAKLGTTSAVGLFPRSNSERYGLVDMAGNVDEWCADVVEGCRVRRGGSWLDPSRLCRCAFRYWFEPGARRIHLGFRLAAVQAGQEAEPSR